MNGKRIVGILVVIAMIVTAMPMLAGHAKAQSVDTSKPPSYLVIVRLSDDTVHHLNARVGNAYQNDIFGVVIACDVTKYTADKDGTGVVEIYPAAVAVRGSNAGDYKIKWLELDATKFSFESKSSEVTPQATDYESSLNDIHNGFMEYNLSQDSTDYVIENWINVASDIGGAIYGEAASVAASEGGPIASLAASSLASSAAHYLISSSLHNFFNVENVGFEYGGSGENPWKSDSTQGHTYMAARGTASGNNDHKNAIIAGAMEWQLDDGVNDRIHVLTLKATLDYAKYGSYYIEEYWHHYVLKYGWHDEHKISTSVTIYAVPQSMAGSLTRDGNSDIEKYASDPANYNDYYLRVTTNTDTNSYSYYMPSLSSRTDTGDGSCVFLMSGVYDIYSDKYFYYRGALPIGDNKDEYKLGFAKNANYDTNEANIWIYTSGDIKITINYNGNTYTYTMIGATSRDFFYGIPGSVNAYITIEKLNTDSSVSYWISGYGAYSGYNGSSSGGSSGGGSSGGGGGSGGVPGHGSGGIHFTSAPPENPYTGDDTAPTSP